jgi:hypothetical protein
VVAAADGEQALARLRADPGSFDLLVLDVLMPGATGRDVWEAARGLREDLPVLFCTGYSAEHLEREHMLELPAAEVLPKPYRPDALLAAVRRVLDASRSAG